MVGLQPASFNPMARKMDMAGHQLVKADWKRLSPTNAVSHSQYCESSMPGRESKTIAPPMRRTARSTVIVNLLLRFQIEGQAPVCARREPCNKAPEWSAMKGMSKPL